MMNDAQVVPTEEAANKIFFIGQELFGDKTPYVNPTTASGNVL